MRHFSTIAFLLISFFFPNNVFALDAGPPPANLQQLEELFIRIINLSVPLAFVAVTVVLAGAGIKYLTSSGEQKALQQAHGAVTWALLGILFLALAWLILLLIEAFTGVKVTQFCLKFEGC